MWKLKRIGNHILFWCVAAMSLYVFISLKSPDPFLVFELVMLLMPITMITSYLFNYFLIEEKLLDKKYIEVIIYGLFIFTASLYFQLLLVTFVFTTMADYSPKPMGPVAINIVYLGVSSYAVIFLSAIIYLFRRMVQLSATKVEHTAKEEVLHVKVDRKNHIIPLNEIQYIESLSNYVKLYTIGGVLITKEKISDLAQKLPHPFTRIHRSFLVNLAHVQSFGKESLLINERPINISRTYKKAVMEKLVESKV